MVSFDPRGYGQSRPPNRDFPDGERAQKPVLSASLRATHAPFVCGRFGQGCPHACTCLTAGFYRRDADDGAVRRRRRWHHHRVPLIIHALFALAVSAGADDGAGPQCARRPDPISSTLLLLPARRLSSTPPTPPHRPQVITMWWGGATAPSQRRSSRRTIQWPSSPWLCSVGAASGGAAIVQRGRYPPCLPTPCMHLPCVPPFPAVTAACRPQVETPISRPRTARLSRSTVRCMPLPRSASLDKSAVLFAGAAGTSVSESSCHPNRRHRDELVAAHA